VEKPIGKTLVETGAFIKHGAALWSELEVETLKEYLAVNPMVGDEIPATGGLRKLRWSRAGMGKRGGARVVYYFYDETAPLFLLGAYAKEKQEDLSPGEKETLRKVVALLKESIKERKKGDNHG
jgi:hypothetical protein